MTMLGATALGDDAETWPSTRLHLYYSSIVGLCGISFANFANYIPLSQIFNPQK